MARVILYSCETHFFYQTFVAANQNRGNFSRQKLVAEIERLNPSYTLNRGQTLQSMGLPWRDAASLADRGEETQEAGSAVKWAHYAVSAGTTDYRPNKSKYSAEDEGLEPCGSAPGDQCRNWPIRQ